MKIDNKYSCCKRFSRPRGKQNKESSKDILKNLRAILRHFGGFSTLESSIIAVVLIINILLSKKKVV